MCTVFVCVIFGFIESFFVLCIWNLEKICHCFFKKIFLTQFLSHRFLRFQLHILGCVPQAGETLHFTYSIFFLCFSFLKFLFVSSGLLIFSAVSDPI